MEAIERIRRATNPLHFSWADARDSICYLSNCLDEAINHGRNLAARLTAAEERIKELEEATYSGRRCKPTPTDDAAPARKQEMVERYKDLILNTVWLKGYLNQILSDLIDEARRS